MKKNKEIKLTQNQINQLENILYQMENHISGEDALWKFAILIRRILNLETKK